MRSPTRSSNRLQGYLALGVWLMALLLLGLRMMPVDGPNMAERLTSEGSTPPPLTQPDRPAPAPPTWHLNAEWDLPPASNRQVARWVDFLVGRQPTRTREWLERTGRYGPMIDAELSRRGMPRDLIYLALIESGLSPTARSHASAVGLWQFMAPTARERGLEISSYVDERMDPVASTHAALDYLEHLHGRFGSWYLAAAAYNTGQGRLGSVLHDYVGGGRYSDGTFWRIRSALPEETRDYVPKLLAAAYIGKAPSLYGLGELAYHPPLVYEEVRVPPLTRLSLLAQLVGLDVAALSDLNPHLVQGTTPPDREWSLRVPPGSSDRLRAALRTQR